MSTGAPCCRPGAWSWWEAWPWPAAPAPRGVARLGAPAPPTAPASSPAPAPSDAGAQGLASVSDVPVGGGVIIDDPAVVITQPTEGDFKAFTAICTHQGCLVSSVESNEILCPCHGSRFSATDGSVIQGPATMPLQPAGITVEGGNVVLS